MAKKIDESTLATLSRVTVEKNAVILTCGQLDRKQYQAVNEILENIGGKWNRKAKAHLFDGDPTDKLEAVLLAGEIVPPKKYGFFPTPPEIAQKLVDLAEVETHHKILEPSAGDGAIIRYIPECAELDCVEILPDNITKLKALGLDPAEGDFLSVVAIPAYHRIVMNPPFENQADIDHVSHACKFLLPGGRLVSVMSAGVMFRENKKTIGFRQMVEQYGWMERLPEKAFKDSGTNVNTIVVVIDKPEEA